jgi:hypothetical protein
MTVLVMNESVQGYIYSCNNVLHLNKQQKGQDLPLIQHLANSGIASMGLAQITAA